MSNLPFVIEKTGKSERAYDIYSRLLANRIVFLGTPIDDSVANAVVAQLLFLQMSDAKADVHLYINSPGGSVTAGMAIYDTMQYLTCPINTYCIGQAASMAAVLLAAGTRGKRFVLPSARVMIHQPMGGMERAPASDIQIQAAELTRIKALLNNILAKHTGKPAQEIEQDVDRDFFMTAQDAVAYKLADEVITRPLDAETIAVRNNL